MSSPGKGEQMKKRSLSLGGRGPEGSDMIATPLMLHYNQPPLAEANRLVISLTLHQRREAT